MRLGAGDRFAIQLELRFFGQAIDKDKVGPLGPALNFEAYPAVLFSGASYCSRRMDAQAVLAKTPKIINVRMADRNWRAVETNSTRLEGCGIDRRAIAPL